VTDTAPAFLRSRQGSMTELKSPQRRVGTPGSKEGSKDGKNNKQSDRKLGAYSDTTSKVSPARNRRARTKRPDESLTTSEKVSLQRTATPQDLLEPTDETTEKDGNQDLTSSSDTQCNCCRQITSKLKPDNQRQKDNRLTGSQSPLTLIVTKKAITKTRTNLNTIKKNFICASCL